MAIRQIPNQVLAKHTAQPLERVERDTERNFWMSSQEAKEYGLIDDVITPRQLIASTRTLTDATLSEAPGPCSSLEMSLTV
jgi:ATP-dependent protease ClpP protease subunit